MPDLADVTLGHPAARGGKGCFAKREDISVLAEGSRDSYETCQGDNTEYELIVQSLLSTPYLRPAPLPGTPTQQPATLHNTTLTSAIKTSRL